jgi:hypothetical protein
MFGVGSSISCHPKTASKMESQTLAQGPFTS